MMTCGGTANDLAPARSSGRSRPIRGPSATTLQVSRRRSNTPSARGLPLPVTTQAQVSARSRCAGAVNVNRRRLVTRRLVVRQDRFARGADSGRQLFGPFRLIAAGGGFVRLGHHGAYHVQLHAFGSLILLERQ